ncbi:putative xylitol oxidase [Virgisporangium aliadipatigenens]|uniref:Putative xylitol oxidase n=1 Tax=Virgisporangium aliadipatigenens TaxID=741659 RepID=A0A8J4DPJ8_9ACTN|nr:FAD-binding protein [Virgisporangium aliadipatigenens]GIJ45011.1 putative xylitol oxidase [Virgisporangium aliadipatigenens]
MTLRNWAGNVEFTAARVHRPSTVDELRSVVAGASSVRALGTGHSFNRIADGPSLVSVAGLPPTVDLDGSTVTVAAGVRYGELARHLHAAGYALHNLGSLPHISVAGAVSTGTHGSGDRNGSLASAVAALELVDASGGIVTLRRGTEEFDAAVVGLGAFGVVTRVTLDVEPTYEVRQYVYDGLPWPEVTGSLFEAGYSVSVFTAWAGDERNQVWVKQRVHEEPPPATLAGAVRADGPRHPVPGMPVENCTVQGGAPGPWHERLPHFKLEFTPSSGEELQSEYLIDRRHAPDALAALYDVREKIAAVLQVSELRTIAADPLWLSMSHDRDSLAVHFTWIADTAAVLPVVRLVEERLAPFAPRPHWGKVFTVPGAELRTRYERWSDWAAAVVRADPAGKFRNPYLDDLL